MNIRFLCLTALLTVACDGDLGISPGAILDRGMPDTSQTTTVDAGALDSAVALCEQVICGLGGVCVEGHCQCFLGFALNAGQCVDIDECASDVSPCGESTRCENSPGAYICGCAAGFQRIGDECVDIDECDQRIDNCSDFAVCTNREGGFECQCRTGFEGDGIECVDVDECANEEDPCSEDAECLNVAGGFECRCLDGWAGDGLICADIDECAGGVDNCSDNGVCRNTAGHFECQCLPGWVGDGQTCADEDECADGTAACSQNAVCRNLLGSFECACENGWMMGDEGCTDVDECLAEDVCGAFGTCTNVPGSFDCSCPAGFRSLDGNCVDIDECEQGTAQCRENTQCVNVAGAYVCPCAQGYFEQDNLCIDVDECAMGLFMCNRFAQCVNSPGGWSCACQPGFEVEGEGCRDVDECATGALACVENAACINLPGSARCDCNPGYEMVEGACTNINECHLDIADCSPNATCLDAEGTFECQCLDGFEGDGHVCDDIDECLVGLDACPEELPCANRSGGYECGGPAIYICDCAPGADPQCVPGDDVADGSLPDQAWRTMDRLSDALVTGSLDDGVSVRFCTGGRFTGDLSMDMNLNCTQDMPCLFSAYGTPNTVAKPVINGGISITPGDGDAYRGHITIQGLAIRSASIGLMIAAQVEGIRLNDLDISGGDLGLVIGDEDCIDETCLDPRDIEVSDSVISGNVSGGMRMVGQQIRVLRNQWFGNGHGETRAPQVRMRCLGTECTDVLVQGNVFDATNGPEGTVCNDDELSFEGLARNVRILENGITENPERVESTCSGIVFGRAPAATQTLFQDVVIGRNSLQSVGGSGIALSSCQDCFIENNTISINRNGYAVAINAPVRRGFGGHAILQRLNVRNNSIYLGPNILFTSIAIKVSGSGRGHSLTGNAIVNLSAARTTCCFDQAFDVSIYDVHNANICQLSPNNASANWAIGFRTLVAWQVTGHDLASLEAMPGFVNPMPPAADFRILSGDASVVDRSLLNYAPRLDYLGLERDELPDVGAFEYRPIVP